MTDLRRLGASDLKIAPLVLGGNVFGWTADRDASFAVLDAFVDGGGTMIDTADVYSAWVPGHRGGESETMIGEWLRASGKRDRVQIATKVGMLPGDGGGGIPIEPSCDGECDPFVVLPGGTVCTLAGCVSGGGPIFCLYSCF